MFGPCFFIIYVLGFELLDHHCFTPSNNRHCKDRELNQSRWSTDTDFDSSFAESIVFDKNLYKYGILGCKTNVDKIMNGGAISACHRDKIIRCLGNIEDDIKLGKFEWNDGVDVHTNIVKALADMVGHIPKDLVITNKYDNCLMILEMWCKTYIDQIRTQMKQFQVALVLLALRNDCLVFPSGREVYDNTLLETLVLPSLKMLEHDASDLSAFLVFIYSSSDGVINLRNSSKLCRLSEDFSVSKCSTIADFARSINYGIPGHLLQLLEKFFSWRNWPLVTPHGEAATYEKMLRKFTIDEQTRENRHLALLKCLNIGISESPQDCEIQDAKYHLFSSGEVVLEMINVFIKFVENMSVRLEKVQISHPRGYDDVLGFAHFLTSKGITMETAYGVVQLCLENQVQPSELNLEELARIDCPCERAHVLLHVKRNTIKSRKSHECFNKTKWYHSEEPGLTIEVLTASIAGHPKSASNAWADGQVSDSSQKTTQTGASNEPQMFGLADTPCIQPK
nr:argininosuccinate lyase, chloroplastic-like [Aegilops tauschii subsp. strangulata]